MNNHTGPFFVAYAISVWLGVVLALGVAQIAWKRRESPGAKPLFVASLSTAWWLLAYVIPLPADWLIAHGGNVHARAEIVFVGLVFMPAAHLALTMEYTGSVRRWHWWMIAPLAIEPIFVWFCLWDDAASSKFFGDWQHRSVDGPFEGGPYFWLHYGYSYSLMLISGVLLIRQYFRESVIYRAQLKIILLSTFPVVICNLAYSFGLTPAYLDFTPQAFLIASLMLAYALFKRGLLDVVPVARKSVVEKMTDGVIVLDKEGRVIDFNPATCRILGVEGQTIIGRYASHVLPLWSLVPAQVVEQDDHHAVLETRDGKYLDLRATQLQDEKGRATGLLIILRDVTESKTISAALEAANQQLRGQLVEIERMQGLLREQALRDSLTGLYNRRFLEETMERELAHAKRTGSPLALIIIDIDHFKKVNDKYGHLAGDSMLQALGGILLAHSRTEDVACRYGGEEFVVVLRDTPVEVARERAEHWADQFRESRFSFKDTVVTGTFSAGVAVFPDNAVDGATLLDAADTALYAAKEAGRDSVMCATSGEDAVQCSMRAPLPV